MSPTASGVRLSDAKGGDSLSVRGVVADIYVDGPLSRSRLVVTFENDLGRTLEGDLVFPLPPKAALSALFVKVGARMIQGALRPRDEARATYDAAIAKGQSAAIAESEGEDLARLRVAPIEDGERVEVTLSLDQMLLPIADGHRLIVPLTYMPRYVEGGSSLTETEAAALDRPRPTTLAARARVSVEIAHPEDKPSAIRCLSHASRTNAGERATTITVEDAPLDRDLQIEIADRPRGEEPAIHVRHDASEGPDRNGPSTLCVIDPPAFADEGEAMARVVTFLVDRSGSMRGEPMQAAIRAVRGALRALGPDDLFNVISFDTHIEALARAPVPFDDETLALADTFVGRLAARGGTEAAEALVAAIAPRLGPKVPVMIEQVPPPDQRYRLHFIVFMTDGDVANAAVVLRDAREKLFETRVHVLGIGDSVHHAMLSELARTGGGAYTPVGTNEDLERALTRLKNAITAPLWTGLHPLIERNGQRIEPRLLEPPGPIDLFAAEPVLFAFREKLEPGDRVVLLGQRPDGRDRSAALDLAFPKDTRSEGAAIAWALLRNQRLTYRFDPTDDDELVSLGVAFGLVNRRVALVGVHGEDRQTTIEARVPVVLPMPGNIARGAASFGMAAPPGGAPTGFVPPPVPRSPSAPTAARAKRATPPPLPGRPAARPAPARAPAMAPPPPMAAPAPAPAPGSVSASRSSPAAPRFTNDEAGLRALILLQKANGLFDGDLATTLCAVAALVSRGHSAREGLFRTELRRTTATLRSRLADTSGDDGLFARLALALLTMPHGDPAPEGLPAAIAAHLEGISLSDLPRARRKIAAALAALPASFTASPLAGEIRRTFL